MLKGFCGDNKVITLVQTGIGEKIRVIAVSLNSLSFQQGFQDRLIATAIIQCRFNFVGLKNGYLFLKHPDIAFALKAVVMFQVAFDLFVRGNMEPGGNGDCPALGAEPVLPVFSGGQGAG